MPRVITVVDLPGLIPKDVWPTLIDFGRYPLVMEDVLSVDVLERQSDEMVTAWKVLLNGAEFTWTERDMLDVPNVIRFEQIDGDLEVWQGEWRLDLQPEGLVARLTVDFDIGIPSMAEILDPIGERAIRANSRQMLNAIRKQAQIIALTRTPAL